MRGKAPVRDARAAELAGWGSICVALVFFGSGWESLPTWEETLMLWAASLLSLFVAASLFLDADRLSR